MYNASPTDHPKKTTYPSVPTRAIDRTTVSQIDTQRRMRDGVGSWFGGGSALDAAMRRRCYGPGGLARRGIGRLVRRRANGPASASAAAAATGSEDGAGHHEQQ